MCKLTLKVKKSYKKQVQGFTLSLFFYVIREMRGKPSFTSLLGVGGIYIKKAIIFRESAGYDNGAAHAGEKADTVGDKEG